MQKSTIANIAGSEPLAFKKILVKTIITYGINHSSNQHRHQILIGWQRNHHRMKIPFLANQDFDAYAAPIRRYGNYQLY